MSDDGRFLAGALVGALALGAHLSRSGSRLRRVAPSARERSDGPAHFERILILSTGHLPKAEADLLEDGSCQPSRRKLPPGLLDYVVCAEDEYGWFVYVPHDDEDSLRDIAKPDGDNMPVLARVLRHASRLGADWIKFDSDGPTLEGLDLFDW